MALVAHDELAGREVAKRFEEEYSKSISYGTLYTTFRRLKEEGWVSMREDEDEDGRIRYFKLTGGGKAALREGACSYSALGALGKGVLGLA